MEEEYRQQPSPQRSGPENVVFYVVRLQPQRGHVGVADLPGDVVTVRLVDKDRLVLKEPRNIDGEWEYEGGKDEDQLEIHSWWQYWGIQLNAPENHNNKLVSAAKH